MNSHLKFLRRVRIHGGECGAVARALHHEVKTLSLPAVEEKVSFTTNERKSMNKKTSFKRIALAVVAALGFGVLSTGPTQAVPFSHTLTIDSATDSAFIGETATAVLTNVFSSNVTNESTTIRYTCSASAAGSTCPTPVFYQTPTADTSGIQAKFFAADETGTVYVSGSWTDSISSTTTPARSVTNVKVTSLVANTYTYNFYTTYQTFLAVPGNSLPSTQTLTGQSVTWTVTAAGSADRQSADTARVYISADGNNGEGTATAYDAWKVWGAATDSAIVANRGTTTPAIVGVAFIRPFNTAGDTAVVVATGGTKNSATAGTVDDSITVEVSGPGYVSSAVAATTTYGKSVVVNAQNKGSLSVATESITILSDGTAGVATITFKNRSNKVLATKTVTFTGGISSISQAFFVNAETTVSYTGTYSDTVTITAYVKDSAGTILKNSGGLDRNLYLFSSDTAVVGDINGASLPTGRVSTCTVATTTGLWTCKGDIRDSGTVTLTLRDSLTVTASTVSLALDAVTVVGNTLKTMTAAYDKTTYAPGERAVLTIKGLDTQGKVLSGRGNDSGTMNKIYASAWTLVNTTVGAHAVSTVSPYCGTVGVNGAVCATYTTTTYSPFKETGMETVVVTMPTTSGVVTYEFRNSLGVAMATISATVVNPQDALIAASTAAAEAATDAAAEAIDAANAATDASNLAAEAADAATVAAEEARDAADAATAAVEELATQVATLMAALKAQLTTLANTVAKIAKKVKA